MQTRGNSPSTLWGSSQRRHINSMKQGGEYFHILRQESAERKNMLEEAQQARAASRRIDFQTPKSTSDAEDSEKEMTTCSLKEGNQLPLLGMKKVTLRTFTSVHSSVLIPSPAGAKSEHLFRQLCAIHWLLEALTLERSGSMHSIFTCWNSKDPGGCKKTVEEMEEEKLAKCMQELFITNTKKCTWKPQCSLLARMINKTSTPGISQISSLSSLQGQTSYGSEASIAVFSEDNSKINLASSDAVSESAQSKEQPSLFPSLQKMIQMTHEAMSKVGHKQGEMVKKTGLQRGLPVAQKNYRVNKDEEGKQKPISCHISSFIKSKSNLCADMRQKFTAVHEEAASRLHDTLVRLERRQEERCYLKYQALKELKCFREDMERMRRLSVRDKREHDEDGLNWFPVLLARLPESVKSDHKVQKILKKLEKYGKTPGLKIHPDTFLKVLADLQVWELCCPEVAAAVEFVRESIVQMPEEDFNKWFQARVPHLSAQSFTI
ncbi:coiled-coil domain-containing protein 60 [Dryobates pubescens]|uniref:coiled-coil domain-containing protein 60 n=1 Tax=Dryobates pubescens TaxID=118200 RepID=UPI0023B8970B|nr:coiled-coil domain-containing protein 60 [Dryobates pubescens]